MSFARSTHFRLIGIHPLDPINTESQHLDFDRATSIHKALIGKYEWFMFYQGIHVDKNLKYIEVNKEAKKDFSLYDTKEIKISISAIVGRNGSGKSSIVELIIRIINNLSAVLFGEEDVSFKHSTLKYIDDVYADLLFQLENKYYILSVKGRQLTLKKYSWSSYYRLCFDSEELFLENWGFLSRYNKLHQYPNFNKILNNFFYTLVFNYSLYGFNYRDFYYESIPETLFEKEEITEQNDEVSAQFSWINRLFHKNDGYQTPISLHPTRIDGQLDIIKENKLAKERMLSLLFYKDEENEYPMRTINGNLHISAIAYKPTTNTHFKRNSIRNTLNIK